MPTQCYGYEDHQLWGKRCIKCGKYKSYLDKTNSFYWDPQDPAHNGKLGEILEGIIDD